MASIRHLRRMGVVVCIAAIVPAGCGSGHTEPLAEPTQLVIHESDLGEGWITTFDHTDPATIAAVIGNCPQASIEITQDEAIDVAFSFSYTGPLPDLTFVESRAYTFPSNGIAEKVAAAFAEPGIQPCVAAPIQRQVGYSEMSFEFDEPRTYEVGPARVTVQSSVGRHARAGAFYFSEIVILHRSQISYIGMESPVRPIDDGLRDSLIENVMARMIPAR